MNDREADTGRGYRFHRFAGAGRIGPIWPLEPRRSGWPGGMVAVICLIAPEKLDALRTASFALVERHIGVIRIGDGQVLRPSRF